MSDDEMITHSEEPPESITEQSKSGHENYNDWISSGKSPDEYMGKSQYDKMGKLIGEVQHLRRKAQQNEENFNHLITKFQTVQQLERKKAEEAAERRIVEAMNAGDTEATIKAQRVFTDLKIQHDRDQAAELQQRAKLEQNNTLPLPAQDFFGRNPQWFGKPNSNLYTLKLREAQFLELQIIEEAKLRGEQLSADDVLWEVERIMKNRDAGVNTPKDRTNPMKPAASANKASTPKSNIKLSEQDKIDYDAIKTAREASGQSYSIEQFLQSKARLAKHGVF